MSPIYQDLSNDTTYSQIKSRVPVPLKAEPVPYSIRLHWKLTDLTLEKLLGPSLIFLFGFPIQEVDE